MSERYTAYYESQIENEAVMPVPDLAYDVAVIRQDPELEAAHLLPGTGFLVKDQIRLFYENLEKGVSFQDTMTQLEQDIQGFNTEYLVQMPVFPIVLDRAMYNGQERLVGALYGGKPLADATSEVERGGVVKQVVEEIEEKLLAAEPGTMIVMTSPVGESGYQNKNGILEAENELDIQNGLADRVVFQDSQTYCYEVMGDGSIRGFTLKSDMDIFQNEEMLRRLGVDPDRLQKHTDPYARIKQAVLNYSVIEPYEGKTIEDVLDTIVDVKGSKNLYSDTEGNSRTADEARDLLRNPDRLWNLDDRTMALTDRFKKYAWWGMINNTVDARDLEVALGDIVLRMMNSANVSNYEGEVMHYEGYSASDALKKLQEIPGCAGGGVVNSVTPRETATENKKRILCCTCPFCNKEVEAEIESGRITCPKCTKSAKWKD